MVKKLLSIAIPTWNRADILNKALSLLLPQVTQYSELIEIIISDNNSSDHTIEVIQEYLNKYAGQVSIITFHQHTNTGYYGNFRKCKELSNGEFFWLLSDNDYLNDGLIGTIISVLLKSNSLGIVFLKDWSDSNKNLHVGYSCKLISKNDLISNIYFGYRVTLISAIILYNCKENDELIFERFKGNSFLSFVFFLNALKIREQCCIISGTSLIICFASVSFDIFESWTSHIKQCTDYALQNKILDKNVIQHFYKSVHKNLTGNHFRKLKINGILYGKDYGGHKKISRLLKDYYSGHISYYLYIFPYVLSPKPLLILHSYIRRVISVIKKKMIYPINKNI